MLVRELFDKGLVTARDPALLNPGEVQRAINAIYRPNSPGLWKAPGRSAYHAGALPSAIKGLRFLAFDNSKGNPVNVIVAHDASEYQVSTLTAESGGTFAVLSSSPGSGSSLEAIHYGNRHYLLNGNTSGNPNLVAKISESTGNVITRQHGLNITALLPTLASAAAEGWPNTVDFGTGYYFFFFTDVVNPDGPDEVESAISNTAVPPVIQLPNLTNGVTVTLPATKDNSTATHRRIYVVGPKDSSIWNPFYLIEARRLATIDIASTSIVFGLNATSTTAETKQPNTTISAVTWTNPDQTFTQNDSPAQADFAGNVLVQSFPTFTGGVGIQGIEIGIRGRSIGILGTATVELSWNSGANWTAPVFISLFDNRQFFNYFKVADRNYRWGRTWAAGELATGVFRIRITAQGGTAGQGFFAIDVINVTVYSGASTSTEPIKGAYYPATSVKIGPAVIVMSANYPPPVASTGDVFESQLVLNDVIEPTSIRYSLPDQPDYFPTINFIPFRCRQNDKITYIRRLNNVLVVGMQQQLIRVNYLPSADSLDMGRGICYEPIAEDHGIMGTQAACVFAPAGSSEQLAYASAVGLRYTDGLHTDTLSEDLDWPNTVNIKKLDKAVLVNEPSLSSLVLYYIPAGDNSSTYPTRALYFSYHPSKIKDGGKLAVAGPVTLDVASSTIAYLTGLPLHLTGGALSFFVSVEDRGAGSQEVDILSREIHADGFGSSFRARKHWLRYSAHDPGVLTTVTFYTKDADSDFHSPSDSAIWTEKSFRNNIVQRIPGDTLTPRNLSGTAKLKGDFNGESMTVRVTTERVTGQAVGDFGLNLYVFDARPLGENNK